jgi:hypothetical protein
MADLGEKLRAIRDKLKAIADIAENVGDGNPPSQTQLNDVIASLDGAEDDLAIIHDSQQSPSLDPPGAGENQNPAIGASRLETCNDAQGLATEAEAEAGKFDPDYDYIGDRTRTLEGTYLGAIRQKFGIS